MERLHRSKRNKVILGVCGGLAEYFHIDPTFVRIICILIAIPGGVGFLFYIVAALLMPEDKGNYTPNGDNWGSGTGANPFSDNGNSSNPGTTNGSCSNQGSYMGNDDGMGANTDFNSDYNVGGDDWNRPAKNNTEKNRFVLGVILVGFGVLFLGKQFMPAVFELKYMIPVLLIAVGGVIVFRGRNQ